MNAVHHTIVFRALHEADVPLLHDWIHRPRVAHWWGGGGPPKNLDDTRRKYLPRLQERSSVKPYVALLSGEPVGFTQYRPRRVRRRATRSSIVFLVSA